MEKGIHKNDQGNWVMPLPFRSTKAEMPNNLAQAHSRLNSLLRTLRRKPQMKADYFELLAKVFDRGHAVLVEQDRPSTTEKCEDKTGRVWYLPHFGVYHPKKPGKIRVVFDSSAKYQGVSLAKRNIADRTRPNKQPPREFSSASATPRRSGSIVRRGTDVPLILRRPEAQKLPSISLVQEQRPQRTDCRIPYGSPSLREWAESRQRDLWNEKDSKRWRGAFRIRSQIIRTPKLLRGRWPSLASNT
ncbi:hypothetical protein QZH41_001331 [Actinostola sp. cb2023]|nr:hypothetical protein QZH41_001331 [Actinostola sp. cb2023]